MAFKVTDQHIQDYHTLGFTLFQQMIPASLLTQMRREADKGRHLGRQKKGPQIQRIQPIGHYDLDLKPFVEFAQLPEIIEALQAILSPHHWYGRKQEDPLAHTGILYEPAQRPYCTVWHRDWRDNVPGLNVEVWQRRIGEVELFNQVNCALYEDTSLWVVPGSHLRPDLPGEVRRFPARPIPGPDYGAAKSPESLERIGLEYCRSMPGSFRAHLDPGDFMLYRNSLWHMGNYSPSRKRATIHDFVGSPAYEAWMEAPPMDENPES